MAVRNLLRCWDADLILLKTRDTKRPILQSIIQKDGTCGMPMLIDNDEARKTERTSAYACAASTTY